MNFIAPHFRSKNNKIFDPFCDYSRTKFCHLLAESPNEIDQDGRIISYNCLCTACGKSHLVVNGEDLFFYRVRSCGCMDFSNLTGGRFSKLTAVFPSGSDKTGSRLWTCLCQCGKEIVIPAKSLVSRHAKSCGCLRIEQATKFKDLVDRKINHRLSCIKQRCYNPKDQHYYLYGAKGIRVCDEWLKDSQNFVTWFKSQPNWSPELEVDRIDGKLGYTPDNCRLATRETQLLNRSVSHFITVNGITLTGSDWSVLLKLKHRCSVYSYLQQHGDEKTIAMISDRMNELGINRENLNNFITFDDFNPLKSEENYV